MAINKTAKNLYVTVKNKYTSTARTFKETAEKITIVATEGDLKLISNRKIIIKDKKV
jgi:hypothetical protein